MKTVGISGIVLVSIFVPGDSFALGQDQGPSILVTGKYVEGWDEPMDWVRGFDGKEFLTLCGSDLQLDKVAITKVSESELEWREIAVSTECEGAFVLSGFEELAPGPVTGQVYNHRFGPEGGLEIALGQMEAEFSLEVRESETYDLVLHVGGERRVLAERSRVADPFYLPYKLIWAGDLNSDNLIDFVITLAPHCPDINQLFLSGGGEGGDYRVINQVESGGCI